MSRSLSAKLRDIRSRVLAEGTPFYVVTVDGRIHCASSDWTAANEDARTLAYGHPGSVYIAQERRRFSFGSGDVVAVKRARSWTSYGVCSMEEYEA